MTEPESLGPCEPGTAVKLQGIVWQETDKGKNRYFRKTTVKRKLWELLFLFYDQNSDYCFYERGVNFSKFKCSKNLECLVFETKFL